ncbi:hypothetical protein L1049_016468 [Liquidambar formosana]|uniref:Uncharacterized protein n=1 Tax=Liquidambar formosana TaxID=63359 RepID=A0AAP0X6V2_LIQFO
MCVKSCLQKILNDIGTILRIDEASLILDKCVFARVCVLVDLRKPLLQEVKYLRKGTIHTRYIRYENIREGCFFCGNPDHRLDQCNVRPKSKDVYRLFKTEFHRQKEAQYVADCSSGKNIEDTPWIEIVFGAKYQNITTLKSNLDAAGFPSMESYKGLMNESDEFIPVHSNRKSGSSGRQIINPSRALARGRHSRGDLVRSSVRSKFGRGATTNKKCIELTHL